MRNFLGLVAAWIVNFAVLGLVFYGVWYWGEAVGYQDGFKTAQRQALKTNPPSEELELVCAGLWIGEQNKKYYNKENRNAR